MAREFTLKPELKFTSAFTGHVGIRPHDCGRCNSVQASPYDISNPLHDQRNRARSDSKHTYRRCEHRHRHMWH